MTNSDLVQAFKAAERRRELVVRPTFVDLLRTFKAEDKRQRQLVKQPARTKPSRVAKIDHTPIGLVRRRLV